tara:strand:- start:51 stop:290 length:240 start_codon:yes stop_codon:yes gene_type:complete
MGELLMFEWHRRERVCLELRVLHPGLMIIGFEMHQYLIEIRRMFPAHSTKIASFFFFSNLMTRECPIIKTFKIWWQGQK